MEFDLEVEDTTYEIATFHVRQLTIQANDNYPILQAVTGLKHVIIANEIYTSERLGKSNWNFKANENNITDT